MEITFKETRRHGLQEKGEGKKPQEPENCHDDWSTEIWGDELYQGQHGEVL